MARRVKIETVGDTPYSARVTDLETGEDIPHVKEVALSMKTGEEFPRATVTVTVPAIEVTADAEIQHVCPYCGHTRLEQ